MENVWKASKTIILFLIIMLVIQSAFGDKTAEKMGLFILFSMLILQADTFAKYTSAITENLTNFTSSNELKNTHTSSSGVVHGGGGKRR